MQEQQEEVQEQQEEVQEHHEEDPEGELEEQEEKGQQEDQKEFPGGIHRQRAKPLYQARESSLVPFRLLTAHFLQKM